MKFMILVKKILVENFTVLDALLIQFYPLKEPQTWKI